MSSGRFKMYLNNGTSNAVLAQPYVSTLKRSNPTPTLSALNAPMISRVYNAKPGCSACGKKVS
jgi:hypothetical protein